jgi:DNA-binding NarL/FixJ family response regulator
MRVLLLGLQRLVRETLEDHLSTRGHDVVALHETLDCAAAAPSGATTQVSLAVLLGQRATPEELRAVAGLQSRAPRVTVLSLEVGLAVPREGPRVDAGLDEDLSADELDRALAGAPRARPRTARPSWTPDDELSRREQQIARLLVSGWSSAQIAAELDLSVSTVHAHVQSLMRKLGARDRIEAVHRYLAARSPLDLWTA